MKIRTQFVRGAITAALLAHHTDQISVCYVQLLSMLRKELILEENVCAQEAIMMMELISIVMHATSLV